MGKHEKFETRAKAICEIKRDIFIVYNRELGKDRRSEVRECSCCELTLCQNEMQKRIAVQLT